MRQDARGSKKIKSVYVAADTPVSIRRGMFVGHQPDETYFRAANERRFVAQILWGNSQTGEIIFRKDPAARIVSAALSGRERAGFTAPAAFLSWKLWRVKRPVVYETGTQFLAFVMSVIVGGTAARLAFFLAEIGLSELARNGRYRLVS